LRNYRVLPGTIQDLLGLNGNGRYRLYELFGTITKRGPSGSQARHVIMPFLFVLISKRIVDLQFLHGALRRDREDNMSYVDVGGLHS